MSGGTCAASPPVEARAAPSQAPLRSVGGNCSAFRHSGFGFLGTGSEFGVGVLRFGFGVQDQGFRVLGFGFRDPEQARLKAHNQHRVQQRGAPLPVWLIVTSSMLPAFRDSGFGIQDGEFGFQDLGTRDSCFGFWVSGVKFPGPHQLVYILSVVRVLGLISSTYREKITSELFLDGRGL